MPVDEAVDQASEASADLTAGREGGGTRKRHNAFAAAGKVLNFVVLMVAVFAALVLIVIPRVTGSQTYTVLTNSMAPNFPPGSFLVVKPVDFAELKYGDVVTFQMYSGRPDVETHRIVGFGATQSWRIAPIARASPVRTGSTSRAMPGPSPGSGAGAPDSVADGVAGVPNSMPMPSPVHAAATNASTARALTQRRRLTSAPAAPG